MKRLFFLICIFFATLAGLSQSQNTSEIPAYRNRSLPVEQRVQDLLGRMTPEEKVAMLSGENWMQSVPNERLGIPSIKMTDGPAGIRSWAGPSHGADAATAKVEVHTTAFPAGIAMGATWDTDLLESQGHAIGQEEKALGRDMILGPTVNINRT